MKVNHYASVKKNKMSFGASPVNRATIVALDRAKAEAIKGMGQKAVMEIDYKLDDIACVLPNRKMRIAPNDLFIVNGHSDEIFLGKLTGLRGAEFLTKIYDFLKIYSESVSKHFTSIAS